LKKVLLVETCRHPPQLRPGNRATFLTLLLRPPSAVYCERKLSCSYWTIWFWRMRRHWVQQGMLLHTYTLEAKVTFLCPS